MKQLPDKVQFRGQPFEFGDDDTGKPRYIIIPPLSFAQAQEFAADLDLLETPTGIDVPRDENNEMSKDPAKWSALRAHVAERNAAMRKLVVVAIRRNYPDITDADLADFLDVGNVTDAYFSARASWPKGKPTVYVRSTGEIPPVNGSI